MALKIPLWIQITFKFLTLIKTVYLLCSELLPTTSGRQIPPKIVGVSPGSRAMFPLKMSHAVHYVKPGLALVGDAAHRIHPMAGQGVNLGFGDAAKLAEILADGASR